MNRLIQELGPPVLKEVDEEAASEDSAAAE